jgi:phage terminase large subunit-like protein
VIPDELTAGPRFAAFSHRYIVQTKGRWGGQPLDLETWQREFVWEALEVDPVTGLRVYTEVGLGLPRKNGKSTLVSAFGHYLLVADGENEPEVLVAAASRDQARVVFRQQRSMAQRSPRLMDHELVRTSIIECPKNGGSMRPVSAEAGLQHGTSPHANLIDELHAHKTADLYTALVSGTGAREQPLTIWITTAGGAEDGLLAQLYGSMTSGPGELEDREYLRIYRDRENGVLIYWYGAPREADVEDPSVHLAVNPASWLQDGVYLRKEYGRMHSRGHLLEWRTFHLNQFAGIDEAWLPPGVWSKAKGEAELRPDLPLGIGISKSHKGEGASVTVAQKQGDALVVRCRMFGAEPTTGHVSSEAIRLHLRQLALDYPAAAMKDPKTNWPVRGPAVAFDRMQFSESADALDMEGINMVDFPGGAAHMGPPTALAYEAVLTGRLVHDGDAALAAHVGSTTARMTERGTVVVPNRKPGTRPNHGCVALVMAIGMAAQDAPPNSSRPRVKSAGF